MMTQLIYASHPFGFDSSTLANILSGARRNNRRDSITGALVCRDDLYLQLVEGPSEAIDSLYARIRDDDRHHDVELLWRGPIDARMFPAWEMLDDPGRSWLWSREQVTGGAPTAATPAALRGVFERIALETAAD